MKIPPPKSVQRTTTKATPLHTAIWNAFGIPDLIVVDNGLDLTSHGVREACARLGSHLLFTPPRMPRYKGSVERAGRTINVRFIHWLPGTTLGKRTSDMNYDGAEKAVLTFEAFEALLLQYITTIHNQTPRRKNASTPQQMFIRGCQEWPVRVPNSHREFDTDIALSRVAALRRTGLHFLDLQYQNERLGELWNRMPPGSRLNYRVNPLNLECIYVQDPRNGDFFEVNCVNELTWPRTLSMHVATRNYAKLKGIDLAKKGMLAKAQHAMLAAIQVAAATSKRALRRMQAALLHESGTVPTSADAENAIDQVDTQDIDHAFDRAFVK